MANLRHLLWPLALTYGVAVFIRNRLFDVGFLSSKSFEIPIICVGNLETGGTGKSPLVIHIARVLASNGHKVALLSRGYGRKSSGFKLVESDSKAELVGDEPLQAKLNLPNCIVSVCENRVKGIEILLSMKEKPTVVVLDDAFQHRWVQPSLSILVSSINAPFSDNYLIPVGSLREPKSEEKRADLIVFTNVSSEMVESYYRDNSRFFSKVKLGGLVQVCGPTMDSSFIEDVVIFSGIANDQRFYQSVTTHHKVAKHLSFRDHHIYEWDDLKDLQNLNSFGPNVNAVITTEKDVARLRQTEILEKLKNIPIFYLPIEIEFHRNQGERFEKLILQHGKYA